MTWGMVAVAGATLIGGAMQSKSASKSANAAAQGQQAGIDFQREQWNASRQDQAPWMQAGGRALGQLESLNNGDYSGFMNSPDYLAARDEGMQGINRHLAAKGGYYSGGGDADRMKFLSSLATQNLGNYRGSLQSLAGLGQSTASGLGSLGMQMAGNVANGYGNMGAARASGYAQQGQIGSQMVGGLAGAFNNWNQNRTASQWGGGMGGGGSGGSGMYYNAPSTAGGANWTNAYGYNP